MKVYILDSLNRHRLGLTVHQFREWLDNQLIQAGFDLSKPVREMLCADSYKLRIEQED